MVDKRFLSLFWKSAVFRGQRHALIRPGRAECGGFVFVPARATPIEKSIPLECFRWMSMTRHHALYRQWHRTAGGAFGKLSFALSVAPSDRLAF